MSNKLFYTLKIKEIQRETEKAVSILLDVPESERSTFDYLAGQYLTFRSKIHGEELRRAYSICTAPYENQWRIAVKEIEGGRFSRFANRVLKVGDSIDVSLPMGKFNYIPDTDKPNHYVAYAGGSGITPIMSIMKSVLYEEKESTFSLLYGNRSFDDIIFRDEIEALELKYPGRLKVFHIFSEVEAEEDYLSGFIDADKIKYYEEKLLDLSSADKHFICGPEPMLHGILDGLERIGVADDRIIYELFVAADAEESPAEDIPELMSRVTLIVDDEPYIFELSSKGMSILDAGIDAGADLPFACKGGVCATCKAQVEKGQVRMDKNYSLEPEELEAGFVLTCQAHPMSDDLEINYDVI